MVDNAAVDMLVTVLNNQNPAPKVPYTRETAILRLQQRLTEMGYFDPAEGDPSGVYDQPTFDAVAKLQEDLGVTPDEYGLFDQATLDAILSRDDG